MDRVQPIPELPQSRPQQAKSRIANGSAEDYEGLGMPSGRGGGDGTWHVPYMFAAILLQISITIFAAGIAYNRIVTSERDLVRIEGKLDTLLRDVQEIRQSHTEVKTWVDVLRRTNKIR